MQRRFLAAGLTGALLAPALNAQSFNLDVGDNLILWPVRSATYGAAAGQPGVWNDVSTPFDEILDDLSGGLTGVRVTSNITSSFNCPFLGFSGSDEALMADAQTTSPFSADPATWTFDWLESGVYDVYTYAWDPGGTATTDVMAFNALQGTQVVGGAWSGSPHVLGVTYALHTVDVDLGRLRLEARGTGGLGGPFSGTVNGFQVVRTGDSNTIHNYCTAGANSVSAFGALMAANGSASVLANDLALRAAPVPNTSGIFFYGANQIQTPFGDGIRCVGGQTFRLPIGMGMNNVLEAQLDLANPPNPAGMIVAGATWNFQAWFRDPTGPLGTGFNLSDGFELTFTP